MWPVLDGLKLPLVHFDAVLTNKITKEVNRLAMELALIQLQVQLVFPEILEDLCDVCDVRTASGSRSERC